MNKYPTIKHLVKGREAFFIYYFDKELWYGIEYEVDKFFVFPVPVEDIGTAKFLAADKAILFMRYIKKHLKVLERVDMK